MGIGFTDKYSYLHLASGVVAYFFNINFFWWFMIHMLFEIIENTPFGINFINKYLIFWPGGKPKADSLLNNIGDQTFAMIGWITAYFIDWIDKELKLYQ